MKTEDDNIKNKPEEGEEDIPIVEVPIKTIYIEENKGSHFNPLTDSVKIYAQFGRFIFASLSAFLVDIILFIHHPVFRGKHETLFIRIVDFFPNIINFISYG